MVGRVHKRVQRTFGYDSLGVEVHLYKDERNAGAARLLTNPEIVKGNQTEFGLTFIRLANNLAELKTLETEASANKLVPNYVLMVGTRVIEQTASSKKAEKFLKDQKLP
jgi:hypothetical protein